MPDEWHQQDVHLYTQMGFWKNRKVLLRITSELGYVR